MNSPLQPITVTRAELLLAISAGHITFPQYFRVSDAVGDTYKIIVVCNSSGIADEAQNETLTESGVYDINADTWTASGGGGGTWGSITGTLSSQTDLQTALDGKIDENTPITPATKTKITYDADGLVTAGADATTADIADSTNKRYVTDAQLVVIGNTSGTNSGNETASSIGTLINGSSAATPNDTDLVATAESSVLKKITWTNVKAFLKTYFDTLYQAAGTYLTSANIEDAINDGTTTKAPSENAVFDALALKAPLASPALTGTPTAPTAAAGTSTTQIASTAFVAAAATLLEPWTVQIIPFLGYSVTAGTWVNAQVTAIMGGAFSNSSIAQNDEVKWNVVLSAGTWKIEVMYFRFTDRGIATVYLDSTSVGTIDMYGTTLADQVGSITGISVATTGKYTLKFKAATKNASASAYRLSFQLITLTRS